jgi:uncharacterized protein
MRLCYLLAVLLLVWAQPASSLELAAIPRFESLVVDTVGVLGDRQREIVGELERLKREKGSEVAVLIVSSTQPETIEQYSIRVAEAWKAGRQSVDDGALLIVALKDRAVRIEVGRGLEGDLTDLKSNRIIQEHILPNFRRGEIGDGVSAGVASIVAVVNGSELPAPNNHERDISGLEALLPLLILFYVIGTAIGLVFGLGVGATVSGVMSLVAGVALVPTVLAIFCSIVCVLLVLYNDARSGYVARGGNGGGYYRSGRYRGGGLGGGFGGGFGGGGFGGGGTFSGGGASGRW